MVDERLPEAEEWLSLSRAAERLSVHPTTLRRWADNGDITCMLTPGGHRRFAVSEIVRFSQEHSNQRAMNGVAELWADEALTQTRQEIVVRQDQEWLARFDDDARERHRELGRQLMGLTLRYLSADDGEEFVAEAEQIGRQYADLSLAMKIPLVDALRAAMFFRDTLVETALHLPENVRVRPDVSQRLLRRVNRLLNAVHLAIAEVYDAPNTTSLSRT